MSSTYPFLSLSPLAIRIVRILSIDKKREQVKNLFSMVEQTINLSDRILADFVLVIEFADWFGK